MRVPSKHDPFRPTNWRWERARWLREHGKYSRKACDDDLTHLAKKFQTERARCSNDLDLMRLEQKLPGVFHAAEIHAREERDVRWTIEAFLLSGTPIPVIAERSATSPEVIWWYEKLFFNVLPFLTARYYITNVVIGTAVHHGLNDREYDLLWKLFGYHGETHVLDFLVTTFCQSQTPPDGPEGVAAYLNDDGRLTVKRKSAIASRLLPLHNSFSLQIILEHHSKMLEIEKAGPGGGGSDALMEIVGSMMSSLGGHDGRGGGILYAGNKPRYVDTPALEQYDVQAAELRAHEQLAVVLGKETSEVRDEVCWRFPEAPPQDPAQVPVQSS